MRPDRVDFVLSVLNADDLKLGVTTEDVARPFTFSGNGREVCASRDVAEVLLRIMEKHWGDDAAEAKMLRLLLGLRTIGAEGGAA